MKYVAALSCRVTSVRQILNWWNYGESWVPARRSMRNDTKSGLWTVDWTIDSIMEFNSGQNSDSLDQTSQALQRFDVMLLLWIIIPVSVNIDQLWLANSAAYRSFIWRGSKVMSVLLVDVVPQLGWHASASLPLISCGSCLHTHKKLQTLIRFSEKHRGCSKLLPQWVV